VKLRGLAALALTLLAGCLDDAMLDGGVFPCRASEDCVEGFECHPTRYVCVPQGGAGLDAGLTD
jgi:hypothetical protein